MVKIYSLVLIVCGLSACVPEMIQAPINVWRDARYEDDAKNGDLEAMYEMGIAHCCGSAPFFDNREGTKWLCRAARAGHTPSMVRMGYWWRADKGFLEVSPAHHATLIEDNAVAYAWYAAAEDAGNERANGEVMMLEEKLTPEERQRAGMYLAHFPDMPCEIR